MAERRGIIVTSLTLLLITAVLSLYFTCQFQSFFDDAGVVSLTTIHAQNPIPPPSLPWGSEQDESLTGNDDDRFALHPEQHIYREPKTIHLQWNVTLEEIAPDGVKKLVWLINGQFPGPTIEARSGDELIVDVHNSASESNDEGISMHWHGLWMKGANHMDGVVGLTQCTIAPSETFTYRFRIDELQHGTFWYHAHSMLERADGLYGGLVIHKPSDNTVDSDLSIHGYDSEQLLLVGDWYHRTAQDVFDWYQDAGHYEAEPAPDSLLINGMGRFECSKAVKARPVNCTQLDVPDISFQNVNGRVRVRVVNTGVSSGFSVAVSQASMRLITVDGGSLIREAPEASSLGVLYPGERMDFVLRTQPGESYSADGKHNIAVALDRENMRVVNPALAPIQSFPLVWNSDTDADAGQRESESDEKHVQLPKMALENAVGENLSSEVTVVQSSIQTAVIYTAIQIRASFENKPVGIVNHTSWMIGDPRSKPMLALEPEQWDSATKQPSSIQRLEVPWYGRSSEDKWLDLVINNVDDKGHPFHLHGYAFYVLAIRPTTMGGYNPFNSVAAAAQAEFVNWNNPLRKDTVYVPSSSYALLRIPLDNSGLWLLHCHVLLHQAAGMGMVFRVGDYGLDAEQRASAHFERCF